MDPFRRSSDDVQPDNLDPNIRFTSIGGLKEHIKCLKEMIIFPLMYPELFKKFNTRPARGVLFHGPPGTGKTLLARALANECSLVGGKRVSFYMRKGADVMNKYYGESEKNLRMLFQTARKTTPSIIFFDEIDALAPSRKQADQDLTATLVATLLAEMDGVCDRGNVIVIGATNRPDAMDPAVRRTGRFDRELYFPPPELEDRRDILAIYTRDWEPRLNNEALDQLAKLTAGYLGPDIKSLCSEAVLKAVKRVYPQIYESDFKLLIETKNVEVTIEDMLGAMKEVVPSGSRYVPQAARPLPVHCIPLLGAQLEAAAQLLHRCYSPVEKRLSEYVFENKAVKGAMKELAPFGSQYVPQAASPLHPRGTLGAQVTAAAQLLHWCYSPVEKRLSENESATAPSVFLVSGECAETFIAPALLATLEHCVIKELSVSTLHDSHVSSPGNAIIALFAECRRSGRPCVIFVRDLQAIWETLAGNSTVLLQLWRLRSVGDYTLMLATCQGNYDFLPKELQDVFPVYKDCIYYVRQPTLNEVENFLMPVIKELPLVPPIICNYQPPPPLPRAPITPFETEEDMIRRLHREYDNLRQLREGLKGIYRGLSSNPRFKIFGAPQRTNVNEPECHNPFTFIKVKQKLDNKQYLCAKDFLDDIDLICCNAIQMNRTKPDRKTHVNACTLHKEAYSLVTEVVNARVELECQMTARRRRETGENDSSDTGPDDDQSFNHFYVSRLSPSTDFVPSGGGRPSRKRHRSNDRRDTGYSLRQCRCPCPKRSRFTPKNADLVIEDSGTITDNSLDNPPDDEGVRGSSNNGVPETNTVLINTVELGNILTNNISQLSQIGLEALIDLHAQLSKAVYACSDSHDRTRLPQELNVIVHRYVQLAQR